MLFDKKAKVRREDFYDRERELKIFMRGIEVGEGLIVVYGVRRIGKTSLVRVGLTELNIPFIPIDLRKYSETPILLSPHIIAQVINEMLKQYEGFIGRIKVFTERILEYAESIDLALLKLRAVKAERKLLSKTLEEADKWARKHSTRVVIVLDEAQELRNIPAWRKILAWAIDGLERLSFVVTGSEVGVLRDFLRLSDPESPLYGRIRLEIMLEKFSREQSLNFLRRGFMEAGVGVREEELEDTVNKLDGIVGWLTHYGYYRVTYNMSHSEALSQLEEEAKNMLANELEKLIKNSPKRYLAILWAISLGLKSWSTIKHFVEGIVGYIPDSKFGKLLRNLVKYGFIEKTENLEYRIVDPLLPRAVEKLRRKYTLTSRNP